ncbi:MAG: crosslink repair DNA glycosylase YcaQ family protein, partial [Nocardioides sp.]
GAFAAEPVMPAFQTLWPRWRQVTDRAAYAGALCYGPDRGRKVTYTRPPDGDPVDPDEAVAWAIEQYLRSYGPAAPVSFAPWFGCPPTWAAERMAAHPGLECVELDGTAAYDLPDASYDASAPEGVRLLPYFDAFVVGSRPRHLLFPGRAAERALVPSGQAGNYPVLLVDGEVAGVWHQKRSGRRIAVTVEPLRRWSTARSAAVEEQVRRLGEVLEGDATLTIGEVSVGPHA